MSASRDPRDHRRLRVVLAEDNDDHALLIEVALGRASSVPVDLQRARDGDEAIRLVEADVPDLLLLDLKMPGRSGHEVLERVKGDERLRRIPVAVLTSSERDDDVARSYGLGGNHFITKPDDPQELEARLRYVLDNLNDLRTIRRGSGAMEATATTVQGPGSARLRTLLAWGMLAVIVGALLVYAFTSGVF
ncbi:MAG: response regulator [Gemmatimonadetes bacterium]|nr:response regulator [Gemmatimonadota bacterium]